MSDDLAVFESGSVRATVDYSGDVTLSTVHPSGFYGSPTNGLRIQHGDVVDVIAVLKMAATAHKLLRMT